MVEPVPENLRAEDGLSMTIWLRFWYHRDQVEKEILRGHLETTFNDLLDNNALIGKETKDREDYVGTMWEGIQMKKMALRRESLCYSRPSKGWSKSRSETARRLPAPRQKLVQCGRE